jgi:hypothetical protein
MTRLKNLGLIFTSPGEVAARIAEDPHWVTAFVVVMALMFVMGLLSAPYQFEAQQEAMRERGLEDQAANLPGKWAMGVFGGIGAVVATGIFMLIATAIHNGLASLLGGKIGFRKMFALNAHTGLIGSVGRIVRLVIMHARDKADARTGLAAFFSAVESGTPLHTFLEMFEIFGIWALVATVVGFKVLSGLGMKKSVGVVVGVWLLFVAIAVGLSSLGTMFSGR